MISIQNLKKDYKDFSLNLSLEVPPGTVTGLIGRNGAGKTTVIKAVLGLIEPDGGKVLVFGKNPRKFSGQDKQAISAVLSDSGFPVFCNVKDICAMLKAVYTDFDDKRFLQLCVDFGLPLKKNIKHFSTGMTAKLRFIAAISHESKLLVLDEPTAGFDVLTRNEFLSLLREYLAADPERSVLITSHISTDLENLCDDFYFIDNGHIIFHEDTDAVLDRYGVLKVSNEQYYKLEKRYLLAAKVEPFGYTCLTNEKQYYLDNYPGIITEQATLDSIIILMGTGRNSITKDTGDM